MSTEYVTKFEHNNLSAKVDEFILSLSEAKADVRLSLERHDEVKLILKENFEKLEDSLSKTRHDCRNLIFSLEGRVRKLEDSGVYDKGVKDTIKEISDLQEMRIDKLAKWVGVAGGIFSIAIVVLGWLHLENLKLINHLF
jgi:hypothetical protein